MRLRLTRKVNSEKLPESLLLADSTPSAVTPVLNADVGVGQYELVLLGQVEFDSL